MTPDGPVLPVGGLDWARVWRALLHGGMKLRPWEIRRLTIPEACLCMDEDLESHRPQAGAKVFSSETEMREYAERFRAMTAEERLKMAMEES